MCQTKLSSSRTTGCKHSKKRYLQRLPSWTTSDLESRDTSPNHRHGFTSQHEQDYNPAWTTIILAPCHTYSPLCDNSPRIHCVFAKVLHTHTRWSHAAWLDRILPSQNTTESNPVHETSCTNSDKNAPDAKNDERHVFPVYPNLSTQSAFN